jgi:hypothetical protein
MLGSLVTESVKTKLAMVGEDYIVKLLDSRPQNWETIVGLLEATSTATCVVKLTGRDFENLLATSYGEVAPKLLKALGQKPHLILVHEAILGMEPDEERVEPSPFIEDRDDDELEEYFRSQRDYYFRTVTPEVRQQVLDWLAANELEVTPYQRNLEAAQLIVNFIEAEGQDLLFRIYIPEGRLFRDEIARLLSLFSDWLRKVRGNPVRQDGYQTSSGRVIEFFGDGSTGRPDMQAELSSFYDFMRVIDDTSAATQLLVSLGLEQPMAEDIVARYAREARRVAIDARHARERQVLTVRQNLESELSDELVGVRSDVVREVAEALVPAFSFDEARPNGTHGPWLGRQIIVNQQVIQHAEGVIAQHVTGDIALAPPSRELLRLVRELEDSNSAAIESAIHEVADGEAPKEKRIAAAGVIKRFLNRNAERVEKAAFDLGWAWIEKQIGPS